MYGYNPYMTIQKLLFLESEAQLAMRAIEKEHVTLAQKAENELQSKLAELDYRHRLALDELTQNAETHAAFVIAKIQAEFAKKGSDVLSAFAKNRSLWCDTIVRDVLRDVSDETRPQT